MNLTFLELFTLVSIIHCFLLGMVVLVSKYLRSEVNKYLGFTLLIIAIIGLNNWFWDSDLDPMISRMLDLVLWQFLYPVTLYLFFVKSLKIKLKKLHKKFLLTPFIILSLLNIVVTAHNIYGLIDVSFFNEVIITGFYKTISILSILFPALLLLFSFRLLFLKKTNIDINWLKIFWVFFLLIEIYGIVLEFHRFLYLERKPLTYLWAVLSILLYWLLYIGIFRFKLSNEKYEIRQILQSRKEPNVSSFNNENEHIQELFRLINENKLHHNPLLNRELVAENLGISTGYLSQLIGATKFKNLSELINYYRVEDVKELLTRQDFANYSLLSIGLEVGFNSKTTFFNTFKKLTGLTPNDYKKQLK